MEGRVGKGLGVFGRSAWSMAVRGMVGLGGSVRIERGELVDQAKRWRWAGMADLRGFCGVAAAMLEGPCWKAWLNSAAMRGFSRVGISLPGLRVMRWAMVTPRPGHGEAGGHSAPATPPLPPAPRRDLPSSQADAIFPVRFDLSPEPISGIKRPARKIRELGWRKTGSGEGRKAHRRPARNGGAGRGTGAAGELRRCADTSGEARHVNG